MTYELNSLYKLAVFWYIFARVFVKLVHGDCHRKERVMITYTDLNALDNPIDVARRIVRLAQESGEDVAVRYLDVALIADPHSDPEVIARYYASEIARRKEVFLNSPAGQEAAARDREALRIAQGEYDRLIADLTTLNFSNLTHVLDWILRLHPVCDRKGVVKQTPNIIQAFVDHGFVIQSKDLYIPSNDRIGQALHIIGLALCYLNEVGCMPPFIIKRIQDWRQKYS